jgi:hypothetical protein
MECTLNVHKALERLDNLLDNTEAESCTASERVFLAKGCKEFCVLIFRRHSAARVFNAKFEVDGVRSARTLLLV